WTLECGTSTCVPYLHILEASVLLVDNLDCHVSDESETTVKNELGSILQDLPKNSTSVCQPLDVSIMGPMKAKLKELWLPERPHHSNLTRRENRKRRQTRGWRQSCRPLKRWSRLTQKRSRRRSTKRFFVSFSKCSYLFILVEIVNPDSHTNLARFFSKSR
ncbi:hypothetical protein JG687_00014627, partial [Phytophthora cactorum]